TALYDVIVRSMDTLGRQTGRRALVVFSDGEDQSSHITLSVAEGRVEASDAVVYTIGQGRGTRMQNLQEILERLARVSGGRASFSESADRLDEAFTAIIDELSNQYLLGYPPTNPAKDGTWRQIRVEVGGRKLNVRARQGYRAVKK
ncbi:MAG: VWA domain-containing protein, partial [Planctomycetes bacterium]|nr:VWA domain-containing protein [Planctomycetota bacterium]